MRAPDALEEAAEHVVVVEEVLAILDAVNGEGLLQLQEVLVQSIQHLRAGFGRLDPGAALDDLEPLLDVQLHVQRSEYASDDILVENGVLAREQFLRNLQKVVVRDLALEQKELRDALVPVMNALVVRRAARNARDPVVIPARGSLVNAPARDAHIVVADRHARIAPALEASAAAPTTPALTLWFTLSKQRIQVSESQVHLVLRRVVHGIHKSDSVSEIST